MSGPKYGEPFFLAVNDDRLDGGLYDFAVDGHPGAFASEKEAIAESREGVEEYGYSTVVYRCVPVAKIEHLPRSKVTRLARGDAS